MEVRYVAIGSSVTAVAATFLGFGIVTGEQVVAGVSISSLVLGITILALGLTYVEPATELMRYYGSDLSALTSRFLEDLGIAGRHVLRTCFVDGGIVAVYSRKPLGCKGVRVGLGVSGGNPYLGVPVEGIASSLSPPANPGVMEGLTDYLRDHLIKSFRLCRDVTVTAGDGGVLRIELRLNEMGRQLLRSPVNLVRLAAVVAVSKYFGRNVEVVDEVVTGGTYLMTLRLGDSVEG